MSSDTHTKCTIHDTSNNLHMTSMPHTYITRIQSKYITTRFTNLIRFTLAKSINMCLYLVSPIKFPWFLFLHNSSSISSSRNQIIIYNHNCIYNSISFNIFQAKSSFNYSTWNTNIKKLHVISIITNLTFIHL